MNKQKNERLIMLHRVSLSDHLFNKVLTVFDSHVIDIPPRSFEMYKCGYPQKTTIYRCNDEFICPGQLINAVSERESVPYKDDWMQFICRVDPLIDDILGVKTDVTGVFAWNTFKKKLLNFYTESEFESALNSHVADFDENKKQQHYLRYTAPGRVERFKNVIYYDINNAHGSALLDIFPRAESIIREMYAHRRDNDGAYKKIFNYFVGMLTRRGFRKTYNWIVQRTTALLKRHLIAVDGDPIYINTDGAIISNAHAPLDGSDELGEFKRKNGDCYVFRADNYFLIQFIDENGMSIQKGNLPTILRKNVDLRVGSVVKYNKVKISHHYDLIDVEYYEV